MNREEWRFALTISGAHGVDHFLKRVFPPLVPVLALAFGFPLWKMGAILGARSLGSAIGQAPMGHLSDRYDRRIMLPGGIAVMGVSFLAFAALPSLEVLAVGFEFWGTQLSGQFVGMLLAMVVAGIGSSTLHPTGYPLISQNVSEDRKGKVLGMWGSARSFGDGGAPAIVGLILLVTGWRSIVIGFALFGLAYAGYLFVVLGAFDTRPAGKVGTTQATDSRDDPPSLLEADRRMYVYPMLIVFVAFVLQLIATAGTTVFLPEFITSEYGFTFSIQGFLITPASTASFYYSAMLVTAGLVQLGTGELIDRHDHRKVLVAYLVTAAVVLLAVATFVFSPVGLFVVLLLLGGSLWGLNPARDAIVSDIAPSEHEGRTFGYLWTGALLISSASPAVIGYVGDVATLRQAFSILAGLVLLSAIPVGLLLWDAVYLEAHPQEAESQK